MAPRTLRRLLLGIGLSLLAGCTVYVRDYPPPRRVVYVEERPLPPPPPPPPPAPAIVVTEDDEVHDVVYREYFGCSDAEIYAYPQYRRYYAVTDDDLYFITFVARQQNIAFDVCFHSYYYDCGRNYDRLVVAYNVPRASFFCSVGVGVAAYPPVYQRTYVAYQENNVASISIQNHEYVALVHMKVGVEYQGHPPATFFAQVNANGGNTGRVIVANRESCGQGGLTATGAKVTVTAQRPWTMPPEQKQAWHQQQQAQITTHASAWKDTHKDQVVKVQAREKSQAQNGQKPGAAPGAKPAAQAAPGAPGEKQPGAPGDPKDPKQAQGAKAQADKKEEHHRPEASRQSASSKEKGKNDEEEKKGK